MAGPVFTGDRRGIRRSGNWAGIFRKRVAVICLAGAGFVERPNVEQVVCTHMD